MGFLARIGAGFRRTGEFFGDVMSELKKVRWPNRKELTSYTIVVLVTVTLLALFFFVIDLGISRVIDLILGK
ncbi:MULTISPECIES: preprotein translocase subunit SecE [Bacillales]|uniref:Protein translocase subunit SecE n=2 Tax=Brevibacillus TaxID=55080 RepID=A0A9X3TTC4_9BACL|nr:MULTISPECIES: preprotein translocase subunit SecE [Bacillales]NNV04136.1 preprotein translocase subunit SecE [Brevibacillus sp. MCWH]REK67610.1 MAG: preprotein translocase subunit SecE [Brevibacillus sp.]MDA5110142.1 preprotein translocase subunit SecE [Brevibacillus thermoruber]MDT3417631.1 preprotein translocase subunit SecE [Brevibacillus aydinogluensis]TRY23884.1 preprotein translocase subunit SecE [Brevibacillus sp. LEMMJ03]